jgi:cell fate (sporulation/competence/biofilm development) regulator YmcA (YheA/YmcA/DUF963 family)
MNRVTGTTGETAPPVVYPFPTLQIARMEERLSEQEEVTKTLREIVKTHKESLTSQKEGLAIQREQTLTYSQERVCVLELEIRNLHAMSANHRTVITELDLKVHTLQMMVLTLERCIESGLESGAGPEETGLEETEEARADEGAVAAPSSPRNPLSPEPIAYQPFRLPVRRRSADSSSPY